MPAMPETKVTPDLIGTRAAAVICGLTASTFHNHIKAGRITPAYKNDGLRGGYLFDRADVIALRDRLNK